jgi:hypothetical protein
MRLPCLYTVSERIKDNGPIFLEDVLLFWWYNRPKWEESLVQECGELQQARHASPTADRGNPTPYG